MFTIFFLLLFTVSFGGLLLLTARKIPTLLALPEEGSGVSFSQRLVKIIGRFKLKPRPNFYKAKELREKTVNLPGLDKKDEIDLDGDYWQRIQGK